MGPEQSRLTPRSRHAAQLGQLRRFQASQLTRRTVGDRIAIVGRDRTTRLTLATEQLRDISLIRGAQPAYRHVERLPVHRAQPNFAARGVDEFRLNPTALGIGPGAREGGGRRQG